MGSGWAVYREATTRAVTITAEKNSGIVCGAELQPAIVRANPAHL